MLVVILGAMVGYVLGALLLHDFIVALGPAFVGAVVGAVVAGVMDWK